MFKIIINFFLFLETRNQGYFREIWYKNKLKCEFANILITLYFIFLG